MYIPKIQHTPKNDIYVADYHRDLEHHARLKKFIQKYHIESDEYGRLLFYKAVSKNRYPWYWCSDRYSYRNELAGSPPYRDKCLVSTPMFDLNPYKDCGRGIHAGSLACAKYFRSTVNRMIIIQVAVKPEDVVCVPDVALIPPPHIEHREDQEKIRCKRLYVVREVT